MANCSKCGNALKRGNNFCTNCGTSVSSTQPQSIRDEIILGLNILKKDTIKIGQWLIKGLKD